MGYLLKEKVVIAMTKIAEPDGSNWQLDRKISIPDIIAFVTAILALAVSFNTLDKRITVLETLRQETLKYENERNTQLGSAVLVLRKDLADINTKIENKFDRLQEEVNTLKRPLR